MSRRLVAQGFVKFSASVWASFDARDVLEEGGLIDVSSWSAWFPTENVIPGVYGTRLGSRTLCRHGPVSSP
jgi:hypothetical protein